MRGDVPFCWKAAYFECDTEELEKVRTGLLLVAYRGYSHWLVCYWSHTENILMIKAMIMMLAMTTII